MEGGYRIPGLLQPYVNAQTLVVRSPGRINLIGEHTDYNNGFVLPAAIDKAVYVAVDKTGGAAYRLHSVDFNETVELPAADIKPVPGHWSTYILGVVAQLTARGFRVPGFSLTVYGDVPLGAGLSSSAAIECATAFALNELLGFGLSLKELALLSQKAEHEYAGVNCGIMDQFASLFGKKGNVIQLDCRSLEYTYFPLELKEYVILLLDTQVKHSLASSEYNVRRRQCETGVSLVQEKHPFVTSLRDVTPVMIEECIPAKDIVYKRCRYVVEENIRLQEGCRDLLGGDLHSFGKKMYATHEGLSKDYEVSCTELDYLVTSVKSRPEVIGARMMGGGFGGCTINIVQQESVEKLLSELTPAYAAAMGRELRHYLVKVENGTSIIYQ
ncbi:MAG: galactokinase [Sphingobacteriales bacterium]|nr:galactokinase [Sphingobacteriales bacterium]